MGGATEVWAQSPRLERLVREALAVRSGEDRVLTHEVGHFLGLGEDYDDTSASMYVCTNRCETHKRALSSVDTSTISTLYAAPMATEEQTAKAGGCNVQPSKPDRNSGLALLGSLGAAVLLVGRRRTARTG